MAKPVWELSKIINEIDSDDHFGREMTIINSTTGQTTQRAVIDFIDYEINGARDVPNDTNMSLGITPLSTHQQVMATIAFETWDDLIAPSFRHMHEGNPEISFNMTATRMGFAHTDPLSASHPGESDVWIPTVLSNDEVTLDFTQDSNITFGNHYFQTYVHEIGHALGLDHPGPYNAENVTDYEHAPVQFAQDTIQYSTMSYWGPWHYADGGGNFYVGGTKDTGPLIEPQTPMLYDVATIQSIYGADLHTREGDSVYGFHSNLGGSVTGSLYDFNINKLPVLTIYDAGGNDTLDVSGFAMNQSINLNPGEFSSIGGLKNNVSMAFNQTSGDEGNANFNPKAVIENAVGGGGDDWIYGNDADNKLNGGAGGDMLSGGNGNDTLDGGTGADAMHGMAGNDVYIVDNAGDLVVEEEIVGAFMAPNPISPFLPPELQFIKADLGGIDEVRASTNYSLNGIKYVENLTYTGSGSFTGTGNELDNTITGGQGVDTLIGGKGADTLLGNGGADILDGGEGMDQLTGGLGADTMKGGLNDDHYWFVDIEDTIVENFNEGRDDVMTRASGYTLGANVEDLLVSNELNAGVMTGRGNDAANYIRAQDFHTAPDGKGFEFYGMGGVDVLGGSNAAQGDLLDGGAGDDFIYGNGGNDTLRGGLGADGLNGGLDFDTADYSQATAGVVVDLVSGGTGGEAAGDTYKDIEAVKGSAFADQIFGSDAAETFTGLGGSDTIDGRGGNDTVVFSGSLSDYQVNISGNSATLKDLRASSPDGTDTIINIEQVRFADQTLAFSSLKTTVTPPPPPPPPIAGSVSIADVSVAEGDSGTKTMSFTVTRSNGTAAFDVNFDTKAGTASAADNDYAGRSNVLHFNAGETTKTIDIVINGDTKVEANETFKLVLSGATNGATIARDTAIGTIMTDDATTVAGSVSIADTSVQEGNSGTKTMSFTVTRSGGTGAFDVNFDTKAGTASASDGDYVGRSNMLHFNAGETTKTIDIVINGDTKAEANETFSLVLSNATNGATIAHDTGIGTIMNDEATQVAGSVSIGDATVTEGDSGTQTMHFTVTRAGGTGAFDVNFDTKAGTASASDGDYAGRSSVLHFNAGDMTKTIDIVINGDTKIEGTETFKLVLSNATNGAQITDDTGVGTILDTDRAAHDFNGDGRSDVLLHNNNGSVVVFNAVDATSVVVGTQARSWHGIDSFDFTGDGKADVLWQNDNGQVQLWEMNGATKTAVKDLGSMASTWHIGAVDDFNGNGKGDVLWVSDAGQLKLQMDGALTTQAQLVDKSVAAGWTIKDAFDMTGDGKADILMQNGNQLAMWQMDGTHAGATSTFTIDNTLHFVGAADFNGDGKGDMLWHNDATGKVVMWETDGSHIISNTTAGFAPIGFEIQDIGDYNHDGKADIIWQNASGSTLEWQMDGDHAMLTQNLGVVATEWHIV